MRVFRTLARQIIIDRVLGILIFRGISSEIYVVFLHIRTAKNGAMIGDAIFYPRNKFELIFTLKNIHRRNKIHI